MVLAGEAPAHGAACTITGTDADNVLVGTAGNDVICGRGGNDLIRGEGGNDRLYGDDGADSLDGGIGNDTLFAGPGADTFAGGDGTADTVTYAARKVAVTLTLGDGMANDGEPGEGDNIDADVEQAIGGKRNDVLTGSAADNTLTGANGNDALDGAGGNDALDGGVGADSLNGGGGTDTVSYAARTADVALSLGDGTANDGEVGENDNVASDVENATTGAGNDTITGNGAVNVELGGAGADLLDGGGGADSVDGGAGDDMLRAVDGTVDRVTCGKGTDGFQSDAADIRKACESRLVSIGSFNKPLDLTSPPGDTRRQLVVEQAGRMWMLVDGSLQATPFLERGLTTLSVAFAPDYATSGLFYVASVRFNQQTRDSTVLLDEYRRSASNPNVVDPMSRREILAVQEPTQHHNGGQVRFGPDGLLYMSFGDGGPFGEPNLRAQDLNFLNGKIIRIDPRATDGAPYAIPASNPFVGAPGRDEIWAYGLRNPHRFSFDHATGDLFIGDPGENRMEEVDYMADGAGAGANYGWPCFEGTLPYDTAQSCPNAVPPVMTYSSAATGDCAVIGGNVSHDAGTPALSGRYLYGDYCSGRVRAFRISGGAPVESQLVGLQVPSISAFGEDASGRQYVLSLDGPVYRIAPP